MEWLRDATNTLEQEDSLLNKGLNNAFLIITGVFFLESLKLSTMIWQNS